MFDRGEGGSRLGSGEWEHLAGAGAGRSGEDDGLRSSAGACGAPGGQPLVQGKKILLIDARPPHHRVILKLIRKP